MFKNQVYILIFSNFELCLTHFHPQKIHFLFFYILSVKVVLLCLLDDKKNMLNLGRNNVYLGERKIG